MGTANLILLGLGLLSQAFLLVALLRQRVHWHFPFFCAYTAYSVAGTSVLLATSSHYDVYYYAFWANDGGLAVFSLLALHEVFQKAFLGYYKQYRWFRMLFPAAAGLTVLIVYWITASSRERLANELMRFILVLGISVNFIEVGLVCLIVAIARTFKLRWQLAPLGIILGCGISGAASAMTYWARSEFGTGVEDFIKYIPPVSYLLAIVVWLDTFYFRPEPGPGSLSVATVRQLAEEMRRDAMILEEFRKRLK